MSVCPLVTVSVTSTRPGPQPHPAECPRDHCGNAQLHHPPASGGWRTPVPNPELLPEGPRLELAGA